MLCEKTDRPSAKASPRGAALPSCAFLERGGVASAHDEIEGEPERPFRSREVAVEARDEPQACPLVADGLKNWIVGEQRIIREVHLRDETGPERGPEQREMD